MKFLKILCITFLMLSFFGCKPTSKKTTVDQNLPAKIETTSLAITGMTCEIGCAKTIESKIAKLDGVTTSTVDFKNKKGTFSYDSNIITEKEITNKINNLLDGKTYLASKIECKKKCESIEKKCCDTNLEKECAIKRCDTLKKPDCDSTKK